MSDLTSAAAVQAFLGIPANQDPQLLASLVTSASAFAELVMNRHVLQATYSEVYNGMNTDRIVLRQFPIQSVASVSMDGNALPSAVGNPNTPGFDFSDRTLYLIGSKFSRGLRNIYITYTAGYPLVPADLAQAVTEIVAARYQKRKRLDMRSETIATQTVAFDMSDMPPTAASALQNYTRYFTS